MWAIATSRDGRGPQLRNLTTGAQPQSGRRTATTCINANTRLDVRNDSRADATANLTDDDDGEGVGVGEDALFLAGNLFDQIDDAPAQLAILDAHERLGQRKAVRCGEEVGHVSRRRCLAEAAGLTGRMRRAFEEK
jgi:hypothetical protein